MTCTFFGHASFSQPIFDKLEQVLLALIDSGISSFYVGNNGQFDYSVQYVLNKISQARSNFKYSIVLSRLNESALSGVQSKTIFPEALEFSIPRFAINKRNNWMINNASMVVCFVTNKISNSYKWVEKARRKGLKIINIAE